ncbi:MAG TPA: GDP-mannose 4,6-dehydratase [Candidatus Hydrogenedentes bacterium]|nr:GDP-mannose 4,6-dehydratase [Candidatus Hydrogenedentota bacterium]
MSKWNDRRVLVTGATGLVGSWLTRALLEQGAYVVALVRDWDPQSELIRSGLIRRVSVVSGCLEDYSAIERAINDHETDTVFHLAAQAIVGAALRSPLPTFETNIRGSYNLLEACRRLDGIVKRVVVASSDKAYGDSDVLPYTEDMPPRGRHPYDVSKSCTDLLAHTYANTYGLPVVVARCGNIYGGGDLNWSRIVPGTIRCLMRREAPIIRSDGRFTRDYVYVKDAAAAYLAMAEGLDRAEVRGQAYNFGPEKPLTVLEIVDALRRLMQREDLAPVILNAAKAEIRDQYLCSDKAKRDLGWTPQYSLEDGLRETIAWYTEFLSK